MTGKTILHYKILEKLGEGGMGIVYLAEDLKLERKVAIKFLPHYISVNTEERERFKIEAKAAASLNHPNIATIYAIEKSCDEMFIVMEYIEGRELKEIVRTNRNNSLSTSEITDYAKQIAEGLKSAHEKGIIHRDIKSSNIMITPKGQIKITDFGLAKVRGSTELTKEGDTFGTLAYMSPEQLRGAKTDKQADIWSFGVVLYEMLTGKLPFERDYDQALIYSILNEDFELNTEDNEECKNLATIIKKSLSKDKNERYQHFDDILADLIGEKNNIEYSGLKSKKGTEIVPANEKKIIPGNKTLKIAILSAAAVLIAAVILFFYPSKSQPVDTHAIISPSNSLAVMYFEDISDPSDKDHTGEMLTNLLITSLSQSKEMEVISREQLYRILEDIGLSDRKIVTSKTAIRVAQNAGVSTILVGTILQEYPSLAVTTRLIDVKSGNILGSQRLIGFKSEEIFSFVDSLALLVRKDLKITPVNAPEIKPVADVTTNSPEAYRAYMEGLNFADKLYYKESSAAFKHAIKLDSNFAMAYYRLASGEENPSEARKTIKKAVELANNTTEREKLLIFAMNYVFQNERKKAAEIYRQLIEKYPHEIEAYTDLSTLSDVSTGIYLRGVHANPSSKMLWNDLAMSYALNNQKQKALDAVNEYIKLSPAEPNPYDTKGWIYAMFMEYDSSTVYYKKVLEIRKDFWTSAVKLGVYDVLKGNYKEAQKYFDMSGISPLRYPSINVHRGLLNSEINRLTKILNSNISYAEKFGTTLILIHLYYETRQFRKMLKIPEEGISEWEKIYSKGTYGRQWFAWALEKNGQTKEAGKIIKGMLENTGKSYPYVQEVGLFTSAIISYEKGEYETAIELFDKAFSKLKPNHESNIFYAISLFKTGRIHESIVQLNRIKNWPMIDLAYQQGIVPGGKFYGYISNVKAHYWLGVAYEKLSEKENAINEFKIFLDTWKDADFNSPEIKDAKVRLQKLGI